MAKALRWLGYALGALLIVLLLAAAWVWIASSRALAERVQPHPETLATPTAAQVADAPRQLHVLGCANCHGDGLRGKLMFNDAKVARIFAPNLTLVAAKATDQQLATAIRQGIGTDGRPLVAMPSSGYSQFTDQEVAALIGALRAMPAGGTRQPSIQLGPLGRVGVATGKLHTQPFLVAQQIAHPPVDLGPQHAAARHIVVTVCAECHGPDLTGGEPVPGTTAPDLSIAGAYDPDAFKRLLRDGVAPGKTLTLMAEVARGDLRYLSDAEIAAIHAYLKARAER